jgi:hypothetical protein
LSNAENVLLGFESFGENGNAAVDTATGTVVRNGVFIDDIVVGTVEPPTGACNLTGGCQILTEADCLSQSGTYKGDGIGCPFTITEDFNSGSINPAVWTVHDDQDAPAVTTVINAVDGVTGDDALMITGNTGWGQTISSVASYSRFGCGGGIYVEFTTWVESNGGGAPTQGLNGPFHRVNHPNPSPDLTAPIGPFSIELGADGNWFGMKWSENAMHNAGPTLSGETGAVTPTWQSRFGHSHDKSDAVRVRFTLGATQGGMIEWFNTDFDEETEEVVGWVLEGDFREGALGIGTQGQGTAKNVLLGFECFGINGSGAVDTTTGTVVRNGVFIDDIVIGTIGPSTGACNLPGGAGGGDCAILTETQCTAQGGTYAGDGTGCGASNIPGDCNQDGALDLSDVICLLGHLFQGNPSSLPCSTTPANLLLMDCNQDGGIDLSDAIFKLAFLFQGGLPPLQGQGCIDIVDCPQNQGCP